MPFFHEKYVNPFTDLTYLRADKLGREEAADYEDSLKVYRDLKNSLDTAREEAWEEAWGEAQEATELKVAQNAFAMGLDDAAIAQLTGLPIERIRQLRADTN